MLTGSIAVISLNVWGLCENASGQKLLIDMYNGGHMLRNERTKDDCT